MKIRIAAVCILLVTLTSYCLAQASTATLSGSAVDESGAVVPGVRVNVLNPTTGFLRTTSTNNEGYFTITSLPPATYIVQATRKGFNQTEIRDVVLHVGDQMTLQIKLKVTGLTQSVTVTEGASLISDSPAVATTIDSNFVSHMPLNGRTIQSLIALTPGSLTIASNGSNEGSSSNNEGQISVNGMRETANYMTIDGVSANIGVNLPYLGGVSDTSGLVPGFGLQGTTANLVSVDDLQEVKVQTSNYSAENGRQPGAQIQLATKSGTNQWHGSLYEYFRNDFLDAANWFVPAGAKKPALRFNDFGGTLGGPLWKDHTFLFFSYEGNRIRLPQFANATTISRQLRQTAAPALQPLLTSFAQPTGPDNPDGMSAPWSGSYSNPQNQDSESLRIDHKLTSKVQLFTRFNYSPQDNKNLQPYHGFAYDTHELTRTWTSGADVVVSPSLENQFRFNWSGSDIRSWSEIAPPLSASAINELYPATLSKNAAVTVILGQTSVQVSPAGSSRKLSQLNLIDTLSKLWGNHLLKFGVDYNGISSTAGVLPGYLSYYYVNLAQVQSGTATFAYWGHNFVSATSYKYHNIGAFAQDTWKVTPRLTLDYGLRWDLTLPPTFSPATYFVKLDWKNPAQLAPLGTPLAPTIWTAFAPRLGASYLLSNREGHQLVLRGGYGLFWDPGSIPTGGGPYFPNSYSNFAYNVSFPIASSMLNFPQPSLTPPYGGSNGTFKAIADSGYTLPRVHQWNLALEQALGSNQKLTVTYVGNAGRNLTRYAYLPLSAYPIPSPDFPASTAMTVYSTSPGHSDYSNYDALQVQYNRRSKYVSAIVNYTWSHSLDTSSGLENYALIGWLNYSPSRDYASSDFDRRQIVSGALNWTLPSLPANGLLGNVVHAVTKDWEIDTLVQYQSAAPFTVLYYDYTTTATFGQAGDMRPNVNPGVPVYLSSPSAPGGKMLNPAAFSLPALGQQGNEARNSLRSFNLIQPDIAVGRTFAVGDRVHVQFRCEFFNFVNHPNFQPPFNYMGTRYSATTFYPQPLFGHSQGTVNNSIFAGSPLLATGGSRDLQLSLRILF